MYPAYILPCEVFEIEKLGIFFCYFNELILFLKDFLSLLKDIMLHPLILNHIDLFVLPKDNIVNLLW